MSDLDWLIVTLYLSGMLALAAWLGRRQRSGTDYFLAGRGMSSGSLAASTLATQCSTNSLLGAPAFVGFTLGGGMVWLQYELAVPLAMAALIVLIVPSRQMGVISIYEILEQRLGRESRILASGCFLLFRAVATGVTIYGVTLILAELLGVDYALAVLLLMGVTLLYDLLGGMRAVVISDLLQLVLLSITVLFSLMLLGDATDWSFFAVTERTAVIRNDWGLDGEDYGFWPMLIGGFFLYAAYYGCDQSQTQRVLSAKSDAGSQRVLLLNGLLRFPLVLSYCFLGLGLAAFAAQNADFITSLPLTGAGEPNFNLAFPMYVMGNFAPGFVGLVMVGLLAAAMSSIDSAINSLSAATMEDFVRPNWHLSDRKVLQLSRLSTLLWGIACIAFSFQVERIAPTILEAVNKVGSMFNGPLLALFCTALLLREVPQRFALTGFIIGLLVNLGLAMGAPEVSWLWWNAVGFVVAIFYTFAAMSLNRHKISFARYQYPQTKTTISALLLMTAAILVLCFMLERFGH